MAVNFGSLSNTTYASRTNTTVTAPTGITDGDELYAFIATTSAGGTGPTPTAPAGFSALTGSPTIVADSGGFQLRFSAYKKTASGESGDYTFTHTTCSSQGLMIRVTGADSGSPVVSSNSGSGSTTTFTGITTTVNNSLIMAVSHDWADTVNNLSPPSGATPTFTERLDVTLVYAATGSLATAGATGNKTMTNNSSGGGRWGAYLIGIAPAATGGGTANSYYYMANQ